MGVIRSSIDRMVNSCCAYECRNRMGERKKLGFFRFPSKRKEKARRELWIRALKRKDWVPAANSRICGVHFVSGEVQIIYKFCFLRLGIPPKNRTTYDKLYTNSCM